MNKPSSERKVRFHYGGIWDSEKVHHCEVHHWSGGGTVEAQNVTLKYITVENMVKESCPMVKHWEAVKFYYMIGGIRFELDSDAEMDFMWRVIPSSKDEYVDLYCSLPQPDPLCDYMAKNPSVKSKGKSKVTSQAKNTSSITIRDSPAANTRSITIRDSPAKCTRSKCSTDVLKKPFTIPRRKLHYKRRSTDVEGDTDALLKSEYISLYFHCI